ncbi:hypothetical protein [Luteimonas salinilitoris]|uniref:Secreted protein n=1 Tax=Luteimonas salinilitoris TaxID=3237697 RepID=A0ABV4HKP1_9GAMM
MRPVRLLCAALLLACTLPALAQQPPIQQQMTPQEFSAAGLDKLSPDELAALNDWLQRRVGEETAVAVEQAVEHAREEGRQEVVSKNRGFFHFDSEEPIESTLQGEFSGFRKGQRYTLENGQVWEQTAAASLSGVRKANPKVTIRPGMLGVWWLQIDGYNTRAKVQRIE